MKPRPTPTTIAGKIAGRDLPNKWRPEYDQRVAEAEREAVAAALTPARVGRIVDEHYRARRAADPSGPALHECGTYCGADIASRLAADPEPTREAGR